MIDRRQRAKRLEYLLPRRCAGRAPVCLRTRGRRSVASGRECCRRRVNMDLCGSCAVSKTSSCTIGRRGGSWSTPSRNPDRIRIVLGRPRSVVAAAATTSGYGVHASVRSFRRAAAPPVSVSGCSAGWWCTAGRQSNIDRAGFERCGRCGLLLEFRERRPLQSGWRGEPNISNARFDDVIAETVGRNTRSASRTSNSARDFRCCWSGLTFSVTAVPPIVVRVGSRFSAIPSSSVSTEMP